MTVPITKRELFEMMVRPLAFKPTPSRTSWSAEHNGKRLEVRRQFILSIDGAPVARIDDWPRMWKRSE